MPITTRKTVIDDYYFIKKDQSPIVLRVIIGGFGQLATTSIKVDTTDYSPNQNGSFEIGLGKGRDLVGMTLKMITIIQDANNDPGDNYSSMTVVITGGPTPYKRKMFSTVQNDGDKEVYTTKIKFYEAQ